MNSSASLSELSPVLYEVSIRLPNFTLEVLSHTPLWDAIIRASRDQNWWFRRTEYLVGQNLTYRVGDWARVYASLEKAGLEFNPEQDYSSTLLIQVLLEIEADPSHVVVTREIPGGYHVSTYKPRMKNTRHYPLEDVIRAGNTEGVKLLLLDPRVNPIIDKYLLGSLGPNGDMIQALLADSRVSQHSDSVRILHKVKEDEQARQRYILNRERNVLLREQRTRR